jgi:hypothetical protein
MPGDDLRRTVLKAQVKHRASLRSGRQVVLKVQIKLLSQELNLRKKYSMLKMLPILLGQLLKRFILHHLA